MAYDDRFVAFLDILGFTSIIKETEHNNTEFERVKKVLEYISDVRKENYEGAFALNDISKEVSIFSDSIIISYSSSMSIGGALFYVLMDLVYICCSLLKENIFIRGGVVYGKMYHDRNIYFGPSMINAYYLEKKAIYPRIIIDKEAITKGLENPGVSNTVEMEAEYLKKLMCRDKAGIYYLDYLSQYQEFDDSFGYEQFIYYVKKHLQIHLSTSYPPKVAKKYLWFAKYYKRTIRKAFKKYKEKLIDLKKYSPKIEIP